MREQGGRLFAARLGSSAGELTAVVDERGRLVSLDFPGRGSKATARAESPEAGTAAARGIARVKEQLDEYFAGRRRDFSLALAAGGTPFQQRVWEQLCRIPYGETISYRELATRVGNRAACRAVARANATNPIAIVVPCHRVIGADGSLTGYGGGLDRKRFLLELEGAPAVSPRAAGKQLALPVS